MNDALSRFAGSWLERLNQGARTIWRQGLTSTAAGLHSAVADSFVKNLGYKSIGFNWELLDANADAASPRSALGEITRALASDIANPSKPWLGEEQAGQCAGELLSAFDSNTLTVVSNRYDGLWNPISGSAVEWGFVCIDHRQIALLLITPE